MKILVADIDQELVTMLTYLFRGHGYDVVRAFDGEQAIKYWRETLPDLVILDVQLPKLNGFEVCRQIRQETNSIILILLTALDSEDSEVYGLETGADDYLHKPLSPRRLLARINAISRRSLDIPLFSSASPINIGKIRLNALGSEANRNEKRARVTSIESYLLHVLMTHSGQVLTTNIIAEHVWGFDDTGVNPLVKPHIRHLRQKIELDPDNPQYIVTVPGAGYTFIKPITKV
jgi:two-component system alkaline phosphatase synthesis response regulator PhoP